MRAMFQLQAYDFGGSVRLTASLTNEAGDVMNPALIRLLVLMPNQTASMVMPTDVEGPFAVAVFPVPVAGLWRYRFESTESPAAAEEGQFVVDQRAVPEAI